MIVIFSYNRPGKLKQIIEHLQKHTKRELFIIDDGSDFDVSMLDNKRVHSYTRPNNGGKMYYWEQWNTALNLCRLSDDESFVFMPDDFMEMDMQRIETWIETLDNGSPFLVNLINDGRLTCFQPITPQPCQINNENAWRVGFTDCGFFCNRSTLNVLQFKMNPIHESRWENNPNMSSGVGQQLTNKLIGKCSMYIPKISFAKHGNHASKMHPDERKNTPLISQH